MLSIRDTNSTPKERKWTFPDINGKEISENSWLNLKREVAMHYRANGRTPPAEQELIKYCCDNLTIPCYDGTQAYRNRMTDPPSAIERGKPSPKWPLVLQPFKLMAQEGDKGLGSIIERVIGPIAGDAYKAWHLRIFGKACGCSERRDSLDRDFPL